MRLAATSCGGGGQSCCANSVCNSGFSCISNVCRANTIADMNFARGGLAAAVGPNGRIYAAGGGGMGPIESYNIVTNHWTLRADIPVIRGQLAAATGGDGLVYAIGGNSTKRAVVEVFSPATNARITRAKLLVGVESLSAVAARDGRIYAIGGFDGNGNRYVLQVFNPMTNSR